MIVEKGNIMNQCASSETMDCLSWQAKEFQKTSQESGKEIYSLIDIHIGDKEYPLMVMPNSVFFFIGEYWQKSYELWLMSGFFNTPIDFLLGASRFLSCDFDNAQKDAFISCRPGLFGDELNQEEAELFLQAFEYLNEVYEDLIGLNVFDDQGDGDILSCKYSIEEESWDFEIEAFKPDDTAYPFIEVDEPLYRKQLLQAKRTDIEMGIDANFFGVEIYEEAFDQPINPLIFMCFDLKRDGILGAEVMSPDDDWQEGILLTFLRVIMEHGIPKRVYLRNVIVFNTIKLTCELLGIEIINDDLEEADDLLDFLIDQYVSDEWIE